MISVILVSYNSISVLPNCINSLEFSASALELEVIVADNGSVDGTVEWLRDFERRTNIPFLGFSVLSLESNRGYAYANNRAIEVARGDYLLLLNPDTVIGLDTIETCKNVIIQGRNIGAVGCRLVLPDGSLDKASRRSFPTLWNSFTYFSRLSTVFPQSRFFSSYNLTYLDEHKSYEVDSLCGAFMMIPSYIRDVVGILDENFFMYGEDIDWCYRIKKAGYLVWYEGSVSTLHLKGGNGGKRSRESLRHFYDTMYVYFIKNSEHKPSPVTRIFIRFILISMYVIEITKRRIRA